MRTGWRLCLAGSAAAWGLASEEATREYAFRWTAEAFVGTGDGVWDTVEEGALEVNLSPVNLLAPYVRRLNHMFN